MAKKMKRKGATGGVGFQSKDKLVESKLLIKSADELSEAKEHWKGIQVSRTSCLDTFFLPNQSLLLPPSLPPTPSSDFLLFIFMYTSSFASSSFSSFTLPHSFSIFPFAASPYNPFLLTW